MSRKKLSLIGAGSIGGTIAQLASNLDIADILLYDINEKIAKGKALDISQMNAISGIDSSITGSGDISDIRDSDAIIITAGVPRNPSIKTREELIGVNAKVIKGIAENVKKYSPNAFVIVVTNPVDIIVHLFSKFSGLPNNMVLGMAGVLDTCRFKFFLSKEFGVSSRDISAIVMGGHGNSMVPLLRYSTVMGIPVSELIEQGMSSQENIDRIIDRTVNGGAEMVNLSGSAYFAPAQSCLEMVIPYLHEKKKITTASVYLDGQYGVNDLHVGVPIIIGKNGVERILELNMSSKETETFNRSISVIRESFAGIEDILKNS